MKPYPKIPEYHDPYGLTIEEVQLLQKLVDTYVPAVIKSHKVLRHMMCQVPREILRPVENLYADQIIRKQSAVRESQQQLNARKHGSHSIDYLTSANNALCFCIQNIHAVIASWKGYYK